jgi:hypothetical protein
MGMTLPLDVARCTGQTCPSAMQCRRYVERIVPKGTISRYAAFHVRREAGSNACAHVMWVTERME